LGAIMIAIDQVSSASAYKSDYLELLGALGMTRHLGGLDATRELTHLCHIRKNLHVLDVGCGAGKTPSLLAKWYGCRVTAVDLSPKMVERAIQRVQRENLTRQVEVRIADAQNLPFNDQTFDAVMNESVLAFVPDRRKALSEYVRVTKPGGYIGFNETSYLKTPVPPKIEKFLKNTILNAKTETTEYWKELLADSGLYSRVVKIHSITAWSDILSRLKWFGPRGIIENLSRIVSIYGSDPVKRKNIQELLAMQRHPPERFYEYFGYGIYVGRK
jgi:SAM-dependent methyltransferase